MPQFTLQVNGRSRFVDADAEMPLLWVLRDLLDSTGTKYGCGIGMCGACTVHMNGQAVRSCLTPIANAAGQTVVTIEGLGQNGLHPAQKAWIAEQVPQCGYCQSGQIMQAAALLARNPVPSDAEIMRAMEGNLCRCGTYQRIKRAIRLASGSAR